MGWDAGLCHAEGCELVLGVWGEDTQICVVGRHHLEVVDRLLGARMSNPSRDLVRG